MSELDDSSSDSVEYHGEPKERQPIVAVLMTLFCPGLGYMYAGQMLKGITVNLLFLLMLETFVIVFSILKFFPLLPMLVLVAAWIVFSGFAAANVVRQSTDEEPYVLKGYNHWTIYAVVFLLSYAVPIFATAHFISRYLLGVEQIESSAMYPTIQPGDAVLIDLSAYRNRVPRRGDLVAVRPDGGEDEALVLRVVGVENDVIRIEGETVFVNNEPLERSRLEDQSLRVPSLDDEGDLLAMVEHNNGNRYVISVSPRAFSAHSMAPTKLSANELFVMADNRSQVPTHSEKRIRDSRDFGTVTLDHIQGEPLYIAWSTDPQRGETRFERIGLRTQ